MGGKDIKELLTLVENGNLCEGLPVADDDIKSVAVDPNTGITVHTPGTIVCHSVPKLLSETQFEASIYFRSADCHVIQDNSNNEEEPCGPCSIARNALKRAQRRKKKISSTSAENKASLAACGAEKLRATVKATRLECKQLEDKLQKLQTTIEENGVGISESFEKDLLKIMAAQNLEASPHMKFFWEQQMKRLQANKMGMRYHPQIIRFTLSLHGKSPSTYREVRDSGALILPSERVLRDYKNYFKPKAGINKENVECLHEKTSSFSDVQRYVAVVMDENPIKSCF